MPLSFLQISEFSSQVLDYAIRIRRSIHQNPELSYKEFETSAKVVKELSLLGIDKIQTVAETGILAQIQTNNTSGKKLVLRSELDALPINEENEAEYASKNKNIMHACGHDAHTAILLSVAKILQENKHLLKGELWLLFQPGEELAPGGASLVLKEGILQKIKPDAIIAQHVLPEMESGNTGFRAGRYMASSDEIYIDIVGKGGHAALPGSSTDQILIASQLLQNLKLSVYKFAGDQKIAFGIGKFIADGATNVIPANVHIEGTLRTFDEKLRAELHKLIRDICKDSEIPEVRINPEIRKGYPVLNNDIDLTEKAISISKKVNGPEHTEQLDLRLSSEDFGYYSQEFPVVFYRFGTKHPDQPIRHLHTSTFDIHEAAMETGIRTMLALVMDL